MAKPPPDWLNKDFLEEALQKEEGVHEKVTVTQFKITPAAAVGENYSSQAFRINLTYKEGSFGEEKEEAFVLKAPIVTGVVKEITDETDMYDVEPSIYKLVLPKVFKKLNIRLAPKSLYCSMRGALLLKDLKRDGYVLRDRFGRLDFTHCKLVYESIAKYHATTVVLHREDPEMIEKIGEEKGFRDDGVIGKILKPWVTSALKNFVDVMKEMDGEADVIDFLQNKVDSFWNDLTQLGKPNPNRFNVLNHGDCWTNNMLFKENSHKETVAVQLIDFQVPRYNTPGIDIVYFFWTSANEDVRKNHEKELFGIYLDTLNRTFEELGSSERLTLEKLEDAIKYATDFLIWSVTFVQALIFCEPELVIDMGKYSSEDFTSGVVDEKFRAIYTGKRYRAMLPGVTRDLQTWLKSRGIMAR